MSWLITILFACLSIMFLMGKGSFLIAGYNTASKEEKSRYDQLKLCKVMGIGFSMITFAMFLLNIGKQKMVTLSVFIILGAVLFIMIASDKYCRSENYDQIQISSKKKWFRGLMLTMILIFVCIILFSGSITTKINNDSLTVGYQLIFTKTTEIDYKDIKKLSYETELDIGRRNFGIGSPKLMSGTFENDAFGEYELYSYTGCNSYIVIETKHGYVVINDKNDETTKQLYKRLQSEIKGSN